jgi:hypothetical protein
MNDFVSEPVVWRDFDAEKPSVAGVYLIANANCNPPFRAACFYDPYYGWTGVGHVLAKLIKYWSEFPQCPTSK